MSLLLAAVTAGGVRPAGESITARRLRRRRAGLVGAVTAATRHGRRRHSRRSRSSYDQQFAQRLAGTTAVSSRWRCRGRPSRAVGRPCPWRTTRPAGRPRFVTALLDVDYAHRSRPALGAWLDAQESPELLPGMPAAAADKLLFVSLLDPSVVPGGAQPTPIPSGVRVGGRRQGGCPPDGLGPADPNRSRLGAADRPRLAASGHANDRRGCLGPAHDPHR